MEWYWLLLALLGAILLLMFVGIPGNPGLDGVLPGTPDGHGNKEHQI